jgi:predicted transcriptional regulator of viral defense system
MAAIGIHRRWLSRLVAEGHLERVVRGRYRLAGGEVTEHHT